MAGECNDDSSLDTSFLLMYFLLCTRQVACSSCTPHAMIVVRIRKVRESIRDALLIPEPSASSMFQEASGGL